jgi:CTP:molybdopterin cytidylyltransferase MocA
MPVVGVVLAAGRGRRIGGPKALLRIDGATFLERVAVRLRRPGVAEVLAVVAADAGDVLRAAAAAGLPVVANPAPDEGMLGSILLGLSAAEAQGATAVLIHPVDHPLVEPDTVDDVLEALDGGARVAVPSYAGRRGHPAGFAASAWPALRAASPAVGAVQVLREHPDWVVHVDGGPGCVAGIDTREDYDRLVG